MLKTEFSSAPEPVLVPVAAASISLRVTQPHSLAMLRLHRRRLLGEIHDHHINTLMSSSHFSFLQFAWSIATAS